MLLDAGIESRDILRPSLPDSVRSIGAAVLRFDVANLEAGEAESRHME